jgi:hypothetical protein
MAQNRCMQIRIFEEPDDHKKNQCGDLGRIRPGLRHRYQLRKHRFRISDTVVFQLSLSKSGQT